jgi:hypothetical protein
MPSGLRRFASRQIALGDPLSSSWRGDESVSPRCSSDQRRTIAFDCLARPSSLGADRDVARSGMLICGVGLRGTACLWQAVPKRFTRTEFMASVLAGAAAERRRRAAMSGISSRRDQSAKVRRGRYRVGSPSWRSE